MVQPADEWVVGRGTVAIYLSNGCVTQACDFGVHFLDLRVESLDVCGNQQGHLVGSGRGDAGDRTLRGKTIQDYPSLRNRPSSFCSSSKKFTKGWFACANAARCRMWRRGGGAIRHAAA